MCVSPRLIFIPKGPEGEYIEGPCHRCWACMKNKVNDLVGRALCEADRSDWVRMLNLTYGDDRIRHKEQKEMVKKRDFQHFMKRVRKVHKSRYLAAGEFGKRNGRAHFHCILFGLGVPPDVPLNQEMVYMDQWPWGFTFAEDTSSEKSMRYVAKYLMKQREERDEKGRDEWITYSKQPLLGFEWIVEKAMRQAEMRVFPQNFNYLPPGADARNRYSFYGKAQEVFFDVLIAEWPEAVHQTKTEWMENAFARYVKIKQERAFRAMPKEERAEAYGKQLNVVHKWGMGLSIWEQYEALFMRDILEEREATRRWLANQEAERLRQIRHRVQLTGRGT